VTKSHRLPEDAELDALMVHDLRGSIAAISANHGFLETRPAVAADPLARDSLRDAAWATLVLQHLVDNMALLATLGPGPAETAPEVLDLPETVLGCVDRLRPIITASEVALEHELALGRSGPRVFAVPRLLRAAIDNLVHVALRHTPRLGTVRVDVLADGIVGVVEVRDGGAPVPAATAADLFTRAGQRRAKDDPRSRYGKGLGLLVAGLAVRAGGGTIEAVAREGKNAFRVAFKLAV
jgi:signal transduction histidine kinase